MSGPQLRRAAILPLQVRLAYLLVCVVLGGAIGWFAGSLDFSPEAAMVSFLALGLLVVASLRRYATARRIRLGLVRVSQPQFDLVMALAKVAVPDVAEARRLHDEFVAALRDPRRGDELAAVEAQMRVLAPADALVG